MKLSKFGYLITYFILAAVTLTATIFAWTTISKNANIGIIDSNIPDFTNIFAFDVKRKGEQEPTNIKTITDMENVFGKTAPGETYEFIISISNDFNSDLFINLFLPNFKSYKNNEGLNESYEPLNILDVFYIDEGKVNVEFINKKPLENPEIPTFSEILNITSNVEVSIDGHLLNNFRISNLIQDRSLNLISVTIPEDYDAVITFTLIYDEDTFDIRYGELMLFFEGIYVFSELVS